MKPLPAGTPSVTAARRPINRNIVLLAVVLLAFVLFRLLFGHHESKYEKIAGAVTLALQKNDIAEVKKYQNAETATQINASRVGRGADTFSPLGTMKGVRETAADANTRIRQFDVTFEKATVHETIKFDPDDKIVSFRYDAPVPKT